MPDSFRYPAQPPSSIFAGHRAHVIFLLEPNHDSWCHSYMHSAALVRTVVMLWAAAAFGSASSERPTRVVSIHYPCMALKAKIEGKIRSHCTIGTDGACSSAKVVFGHPLFGTAALENAKKWRFPPLKTGTQSRTADIDYQFEIRGIRIPEDNSDVEVTFELPDRVIIVAPFDGKVPCRVHAPD